MTIQEAINALNRYPNKNEEIIIAWWDAESFQYTPEEWPKVVDSAENYMDWSNDHESIEIHGDIALSSVSS